MAKSREDYLNNNDFEGALIRYEITTGRWKKYWWEALEAIFHKVESLAHKYVLDPIKMIVTKLTGVQQIIWENDTQQLNYDLNGHQTLYYFVFYDRRTGEKLFDKIGTTTRLASKRLNEEIRYYNNHGFDIGLVRVKLLKDCGENPAESYESFLRSILTKKFPNTWKKNDRFFGADITTETIKKGINLFETMSLAI